MIKSLTKWTPMCKNIMGVLLYGGKQDSLASMWEWRLKEWLAREEIEKRKWWFPIPTQKQGERGSMHQWRWPWPVSVRESWWDTLRKALRFFVSLWIRDCPFLNLLWSLPSSLFFLSFSPCSFSLYSSFTHLSAIAIDQDFGI